MNDTTVTGGPDDEDGMDEWEQYSDPWPRWPDVALLLGLVGAAGLMWDRGHEGFAAGIFALVLVLLFWP